MRFNGRVTQVTEIEEGISNSGNPWKKRVFRVDETSGDYPACAYFTLFGKVLDKIDIESMMGKEVEVSFNLNGRSFNTQSGRTMYSNDVSAWAVKVSE